MRRWLESGWRPTGTDGFLYFSLNHALTAADRARLVLHVGGGEFPLSDAHFESGTRTYHWRNTGLDWSSTDQVKLRLRASPAAPTAVTASAPPRTGGLLEVEWSAPASAPTESITDYEVKYWKAADPENENRRSRTARTESAGTRLLIYPFLDASTEYDAAGAGEERHRLGRLVGGGDGAHRGEAADKPDREPGGR